MRAMRGARRGALSLTGALLAVAAGVALVVGGVGGAVASGGASKTTAHVVIKSFKYHPKPLKIHKGTRVAFTNKDHAPHTATHPGMFNTGVIGHNKTKFHTFSKKGIFHFHCTIHPNMKGTVVVH